MSGADLLTEREWTILRLVSDGLSNRAIADRLSLSVNTVKWYTSQTFQKLGVHSRTQAVAAVRRLAQADRPPPDRYPLPTALTPLVGRTEEQSEILTLLQSSSKTRLITIVGTGGIGKTRLAQAVAAAWEQERPEPVCWVALDGLADPDRVIPAIAAALGFQFGDRADPRRQLLTGLRRRSLLLVLDNFEHLLDAAPFVTDLLAAVPGLVVLATSRERLNLQGEVVYRLQGLAFPRPAEDWHAYSAVQLFLQVARRAKPGYAPDPSERLHIARICQLAEGMPLAIELAAAWVDVLEPEAIAAEIEAGIAILRTTARDVPARHSSIQAVFEHSWHLLEPAEQAAFSKLAVFRGGFDRRAAETVAGASLFLLSTLVDKSLVMRVGPARYKLHELLRQFAEEKLQVDVEQCERTLDDHCRHYGTLLSEFEEVSETRIEQQTASLLGLIPDNDNLLAGWHRAVNQPLIEEIGRYAYSITLVLVTIGLFGLGEETMRRALSQVESNAPMSTIDRVRLLAELGWFCIATSKYGEARAHLEEALDLSNSAREVVESDPQIVCCLLLFLAYAVFRTGDIELATEHTTQGLSLSRQVNFEFVSWNFLYQLGEFEFALGNYEEAASIHQEAVEQARQSGFIIGLLYALSTLACDYCALGDVDRARDLVVKALEINGPLQLVDPTFSAVLAIAMMMGQSSGLLVDLESLAILYHHPQFGGGARHKADSVLEKLHARVPAGQVEAALAQAAQGQLSTPLLEPDFVIDGDFMARLVLALDEVTNSNASEYEG